MSTSTTATKTSPHTLLAASQALNLLLTRRRKSHPFRTIHMPSSSTIHPNQHPHLSNPLRPKPIKKSKKKTNNKVLTEAEESRLKQEQERQRVEENVRKLKKLGRETRKERELRKEIQQLKEERDLRRKTKVKRKRGKEEMDIDESD